MSDVMTDSEQVKAVVQGFSAWMPVISTLAGGVLAGGVALLVSRVNHRYAREREGKRRLSTVWQILIFLRG